MNRRQFVKTAAGVTALLAAERKAFGFYQSPGLKKFAQALRGIDKIPVAAPDAFAAPVTGVKHYTMDINQYEDKLHPALGPTRLWGYHPRQPLVPSAASQAHLGGIIVVEKGVPIQVTFQNNLPGMHFLPVDVGGFFPDAGMPQNKVAVHLHGGLVPWISDGGPFDWWAPGLHGESFMNNVVLNPGATTIQAEYYYPNAQSARLMWYHDHAHDLTRINAYGGIASAYIIRDNFERSLIPLGLPGFIETGGNEIPIVIQDKIFVDQNTIAYFDPEWPGYCPATTGSLWYPHFYDYKRWQLGPYTTLPPRQSIIPEMFGDTMLVNGSVFPEGVVEPRRYRLRILNACNARFMNLQTYVDDGTPDSITLNVAGNPTNKPGPDYLVIGTEGGFLETPHKVNAQVPFNPVTLKGSLITGPGERWDMIIDFSAFAGKRIVLYNDAPAPFPGGDPVNDHYFGGPGSPSHPGPGFGPNTRQLMRFVVGLTAKAPADLPLAIAPGFNMKPGLDPFLVAPGTSVAGGVLNLPVKTLQGKTPKIRHLTLNEDFDTNGRLIQMIGTDQIPAPGAPSFGRLYMDAATEIVKAGDVEIWQIANLTADVHPMHFHLVNVQVLGRQPFNALTYVGGPITAFTGPAANADPTERGWKETVKMYPGEVTTVIMQFTLPTVPFPIPLSKRLGLGLTGANSGGGHEYVWHCHILEHEEHDMMRPLVVMP